MSRNFMPATVPYLCIALGVGPVHRSHHDKHEAAVVVGQDLPRDRVALGRGGNGFDDVHTWAPETRPGRFCGSLQRGPRDQAAGRPGL